MRSTLAGVARCAAVWACAPLVTIGVAHAQHRDVEEIVNAGGVNAEDKESRLSLSTGMDFSSGHFGDPDRTDIVVVPASLRFRASDWLSLNASIPWIRINGPNVVLGPDNKPLPGFPIARQARSGIGDLGLSATLSVPTGNTSRWLVDVTGRVKLPTASKTSGVTTGQTDFSTAIDVSYIVGKWVPTVSVGMRFPGDPAAINLRSSKTASVGMTRILKKGAVIASYDYESAISPFSVDSHSLFLAYSRPFGKRIDLTGYGVGGLSQGAAGIEAGLLITIKLD